MSPVPAAPAPPVLVHGEPAAVRRWIRRQAGGVGRFVAGETGDKDAGAAPPVCLAIERFPEEWSPNAVRALTDRWPLSAWIVACGPWASGGGRTGSPWPAAVRCGEPEAARRIAAAVRGEPIPGLLGSDAVPPAPPPMIGPVEVFSPDRVYRESILRLWGGDRGPIWEAWDLDGWDDAREARLIRSRLTHPERVRVGVTSFDSESSPSRACASDLDLTVSKWDPLGVAWDAVQSLSAAISSSD